MTHYDRTIEIESLIGATGSVGTNNYEPLDEVVTRQGFKGVFIENIAAVGSGLNLRVTLEKFLGDPNDNMFKLLPGKTVFLPLKVASEVRVAGDGGGAVDYSWYAY